MNQIYGQIVKINVRVQKKSAEWKQKEKMSDRKREKEGKNDKKWRGGNTRNNKGMKEKTQRICYNQINMTRDY